MTILFGLRGVRVREVARHDVHGCVVHVLTDDAGAAAGPVCGILSTTIQQRRTTRPRDLAQREERLVVRWHKRQWSCREQPGPRIPRVVPRVVERAFGLALMNERQDTLLAYSQAKGVHQPPAWASFLTARVIATEVEKRESTACLRRHHIHLTTYCQLFMPPGRYS